MHYYWEGEHSKIVNAVKTNTLQHITGITKLEQNAGNSEYDKQIYLGKTPANWTGAGKT